MDIEKELMNLVSEASDLPESMNMERIKKTTKKRKNIHTAVVAGRSVLAVAAVFFLSLFIGVNTSKSFAVATSDIPLLGSISRKMIIRDEIKKALEENEDFEEFAEKGGIHEVAYEQTSENGNVTVTIDSYIADSLAFGFLVKVQTNVPLAPGEELFLHNLRLVDTVTGEELGFRYADGTLFEEADEFHLVRVFWDKPSTNVALLFDVAPLQDVTKFYEHFRFDFSEMELTPLKRYVIDQTVDFDGYSLTVADLLVSETTTYACFKDPYMPGFDFYNITIDIKDADGNYIGEPRTEYNYYMQYYRDDGESYFYTFLPSIYYADTDSIDLVFKQVVYEPYSTDILTVYPDRGIATYMGVEYPVEVYGSDVSYSDFGLTENPELSGTETELFLVPYDSSIMPEFNYPCYVDENGRVQKLNKFTYPRKTIDGQEYYVFQTGTYASYLGNEYQTAYSFLHADNIKERTLSSVISVDLSNPAEEGIKPTAPVYKSGIPVNCSFDLEMLDIEFEEFYEHREFDEFDIADDVVQNFAATINYSTLKINTPGYVKLKEAIKNAEDEVLSSIREKYEKACFSLENKEPANDSSPSYYADTKTYRADSKITSFSIIDRSEYPTKVSVYNLYSDSGNEITFDDIITDKDAFERYLTEQVNDFYTIKYGDDERRNRLEEKRHQMISDGTLPIALSYDGIFFICEEDSYEYNHSYVKISALDHPEFFNQELFGQAPEYYTLHGDAKGRICWDFNNDGDMDALYLRKGVSDISNELANAPHYLCVNDKEYELPESSDEIYTLFVQSDDGQYIFVYSTIMEIDFGYDHIVPTGNHTDFMMELRLEADGSLTFVTDDCVLPFVYTASYSNRIQVECNNICIDPRSFKSYRWISMGWEMAMNQDYSLLGCGGIAKAISPLYCESGKHTLTNNFEFSASLYDPDTKVVGDEVKVPEYSTCSLTEYNTETKSAVMYIIPQNGSEEDGYYVRVICTDNVSNNVLYLFIDGRNCSEIFS